MAGFRPRSFLIFCEQRKQHLKANQIGRTDHSDTQSSAVVHEKIYREMLAGELQTDDALARVAKRLGLTAEQVTYEEGEKSEPVDLAIRQLATNSGEELWSLLMKNLSKASKQKYVGIERVFQIQV